MMAGRRKAIGGAIICCVALLGWLALRTAIVRYLLAAQTAALVVVEGPENVSPFEHGDDLRVAYAALCTNMRTVYPALVLFRQLQEVSDTRRDAIVMMPEELAARTAGLFDALHVKIWTLPRERAFQVDYPVQNASTRKRDQILWNKLYAWKLVEYEKIILLDTDLLLIQSVDELFRLDVHLAGVPAMSPDEKIIFWDPPEPFEADPLDQNSWQNFTKPTRFEMHHSGLNGGVLLLRPSAEVFGELVLAARQLKERTCCPTQEFIYRFFELKGQYHRLPAIYNMRKFHKLSEEERMAWQDIKVYHFVEKKKPWLLGRRASQPHKFASLWWVRADRTDELLNVALGQDEDRMAMLRQARHEAINPFSSS